MSKPLKVNKHIDFTKFDKHKKVMKLMSGEAIVGTDVDDQNRLIYIINRNGELVASYAVNENPVLQVAETEPQVTTINFSNPNKHAG